MQNQAQNFIPKKPSNSTRRSRLTVILLVSVLVIAGISLYFLINYSGVFYDQKVDWKWDLSKNHSLMHGNDTQEDYFIKYAERKYKLDVNVRGVASPGDFRSIFYSYSCTVIPKDADDRGDFFQIWIKFFTDKACDSYFVYKNRDLIDAEITDCLSDIPINIKVKSYIRYSDPPQKGEKMLMRKSVYDYLDYSNYSRYLYIYIYTDASDEEYGKYKSIIQENLSFMRHFAYVFFVEDINNIDYMAYDHHNENYNDSFHAPT